MLKPPTFLLPALVLLAGCSSLGYERQSLTEIVEYYGGEASIKQGYHFGSSAELPRGRYLDISLRSPHLGRRYPSLEVPASGCAYLAYHSLAASEPDRYAYYRVRLTDPDSSLTRTYTYPAATLAQAEQAADNLVTLIAAWQQHEFLAAAGTVNPVALGTTPADSLLPFMLRVGHHLAPIGKYYIEGFRLEDTPVAGKSVPLVRLLVTVPHAAPQPPALFQAFINPALPPGGKFLYGLR